MKMTAEQEAEVRRQAINDQLRYIESARIAIVENQKLADKHQANVRYSSEYIRNCKRALYKLGWKG